MLHAQKQRITSTIFHSFLLFFSHVQRIHLTVPGAKSVFDGALVAAAAGNQNPSLLDARAEDGLGLSSSGLCANFSDGGLRG